MPGVSETEGLSVADWGEEPEMVNLQKLHIYKSLQRKLFIVLTWTDKIYNSKIVKCCLMGLWIMDQSDIEINFGSFCKSHFLIRVSSSGKVSLGNFIIWLLLSLYKWPKVILLSGACCIENEFSAILISIPVKKKTERECYMWLFDEWVLKL